jgi:hypothetical protein
MRHRGGGNGDRIIYAVPQAALACRSSKELLLILVMFLSGAMLLRPILAAPPPMKDRHLNATHLINHQNAVLLDVREAEFAGKLTAATQCRN